MRIFRDVSILSADLISKVTWRIVEWAMVGKEFSNSNHNDILYNWEPCLGVGLLKVRISITWSPPPLGLLKLNMDGASRGKPRPAAIGGVLRDCKGNALIIFSKHVGV